MAPRREPLADRSRRPERLAAGLAEAVAVRGPGERSGAKAGRTHPEVAAVLLDHDVGRELRRAEQRVQAIVDRHGLVDASGIPMPGRELIPRIELDQGKPVGQIAVDLVGGTEDEGRLGRVETGVFEHVERAARVDVEIGERLAGGPVVARLRRRMDHEDDVAPISAKDSPYRVTVTHVDAGVGVPVAEAAHQSLPVPGRGGLGPEEVAAHVVVDAHHMQAQPGEVPGGFRPDQSGRAGNHRNAHAVVNERRSTS